MPKHDRPSPLCKCGHTLEQHMVGKQCCAYPGPCYCMEFYPKPRRK